MALTRRSLSLLLLAPYARLAAAQSIPNPNQDRLGFPQPQPPRDPGEGKARQNSASRRSHVEALRLAEELVTRSQQLRDDIRKAGNYVVPVSAIKQTETIEKLSRKIRGELKS